MISETSTRQLIQQTEKPSQRERLHPRLDIQIKLAHRVPRDFALPLLPILEHERQRPPNILVLNQGCAAGILVALLEEEAAVPDKESVERSLPLECIGRVFLQV